MRGQRAGCFLGGCVLSAPPHHNTSADLLYAGGRHAFPGIDSEVKLREFKRWI